MSDLAGHYTLQPGSVHSIQGNRPVMGGARLAAVLRGRTGESAVHMLGLVLTLCAHAQRYTAQLAIWAAQHQAPANVTPEFTRQLQHETARDHLLNMVLGWGLPLNPALSAAIANPTAQALADGGVHEPILQRLAQWHGIAHALQPSTRLLDVLHTDASQQAIELTTIAEHMASHPDFCLLPQWQGACAETGVWSRLRDRRSTTPGTLPHSAWSRLNARWLELQALVASPDAVLLSSGAIPLGDGAAIGWCEMARGLLLHWVRLGKDHRVIDYRVLAPTEWNFHPQGALARALSALRADAAASTHILSAAYDPCVSCSIASKPKETTRA